MRARLGGVLLAVALVVALGALAAAGGPDGYCMVLRPICHIGQAPMCVCATRSITSCAWVCVGKP
jgi:hypothetical protein